MVTFLVPAYTINIALLVPAYPSCPGKEDIKWVYVCLFVCVHLSISALSCSQLCCTEWLATVWFDVMCHFGICGVCDHFVICCAAVLKFSLLFSCWVVSTPYHEHCVYYVTDSNVQWNNLCDCKVQKLAVMFFTAVNHDWCICIFCTGPVCGLFVLWLNALLQMSCMCVILCTISTLHDIASHYQQLTVALCSGSCCCHCHWWYMFYLVDLDVLLKLSVHTWVIEFYW